MKQIQPLTEAAKWTSRRRLIRDAIACYFRRRTNEQERAAALDEFRAAACRCGKQADDSAVAKSRTAVARSSSGAVLRYIFRSSDDVTSAHSGPYGGRSIPLQRVTSLRRRAQANAPAASYWLRRVLNDADSRQAAPSRLTHFNSLTIDRRARNGNSEDVHDGKKMKSNVKKELWSRYSAHSVNVTVTDVVCVSLHMSRNQRIFIPLDGLELLKYKSVTVNIKVSG